LPAFLSKKFGKILAKSWLLFCKEIFQPALKKQPNWQNFAKSGHTVGESLFFRGNIGGGGNNLNSKSLC